MNAFDWGQLSDDAEYKYSGSGVTAKARCFLLFAVIIGVSGIAGAVYVLVHDYIKAKPPEGIYPGIALVIQTLAIFGSAFVMRVGTIEPEQ